MTVPTNKKRKQSFVNFAPLKLLVRYRKNLEGDGFRQIFNAQDTLRKTVPSRHRKTLRDQEQQQRGTGNSWVLTWSDNYVNNLTNKGFIITNNRE